MGTSSEEQKTAWAKEVGNLADKIYKQERYTSRGGATISYEKAYDVASAILAAYIVAKSNCAISCSLDGIATANDKIAYEISKTY